MTLPATNRPLFHQTPDKILERALNSMTLACEAVTNENKLLRENIAELQADIAQLKDKLIINQT